MNDTNKINDDLEFKPKPIFYKTEEVDDLARRLLLKGQEVERLEQTNKNLEEDLDRVHEELELVKAVNQEKLKDIEYLKDRTINLQRELDDYRIAFEMLVSELKQ